MPVYFSRAGGGQKNTSPVIQVLSNRGTDVVATNDMHGEVYQDWIDITTIEIRRESSNSRFHLSFKGKCRANKSGNAYGAPKIRIALSAIDADANDADSLLDWNPGGTGPSQSEGEGQQASDSGGYDTTHFSHYMEIHQTSAGIGKYRLQLKCNRYGDDSYSQISAIASGSLEIIESEIF